MTYHQLLRTQRPTLLLGLALALGAGCRGVSDSEQPGNPAGGADSSGAGRAGGGAGGGGGDGSPRQEPGAFDDEVFEGVAVDSIPLGTAPEGCDGGFDLASGALSLQLDSEVAALHLAVAPDGQLVANGVGCTYEEGKAVMADIVVSIDVTGSTGANELILDLSTGQLGAALLAQAAAIEIDLGEGLDALTLVGSDGGDAVRVGESGGTAMFSIDGDVAQISALGFETLVVSLGPGDDYFDARGGDHLGSPLAMSVSVFGGGGADELSGGAGDDELSGGAGEDTFRSSAGGDGSDVYIGDDGIDTMHYGLRDVPLVVSLDDLPNDGASDERDDVRSSVENLVGGSAADSLVGSDLDNVLAGGPGDDELSGGAGDDTFLERDREGSDVMNGGEGADTVDYADRSVDLHVTLCIAADERCQTGACGCEADDGEQDEADTLANVENAHGGNGNDVLIGNEASNIFYGGSGDDELYGGSGDDVLYGDGGDDRMVGDEGEDLLDGSDGDDTFDAGEGQGDICAFQPPEEPLGCELY